MPFVRVGRPGLIGTMARTAVVAGTATAVAGGVAANQQRKAEQRSEAQAYEQQQAQAEAAARQAAPQQPAAAEPVDDQTAQLQRLAALHSQGILTDEEFAAAKAKALGI